MASRCSSLFASPRKSRGGALLPGMAVLLPAILVHLPQPASALNWSWSFTRAATATRPAISSYGTITTTDTPDANGFFTITGLTGVRNNVPITGLLPPDTAIPGNCISASNCFKSDNLLQRSSGAPSAPQLTVHGFGISLADGTYANYYYADFLNPRSHREYFSAPPFGFIPPGPEDSELRGTFRAATAPGPLPLAGALLGWSWARRLRQRGKATILSKL